MIEIKCNKCGGTTGYLKAGNVHTGLYCSQCNSWIKWVSKNEISILESDESISNDIFEEVIDIDSLKNQRDELNKQIDNYYKEQTKNEQTKNEITKNNDFIGKTFKRLITKEIMEYYKILDVEEDNQYRMKTLSFSLPIKSIISKNSYEETSLFNIKTIDWFSNSMSDFEQHKQEMDSYIQISKDEYRAAFNKRLEQIRDIINNE